MQFRKKTNFLVTYISNWVPLSMADLAMRMARGPMGKISRAISKALLYPDSSVTAWFKMPIKSNPTNI